METTIKKLPFYSYSEAGGSEMVAIQISESDKLWDECPATIHEVKNWREGATIAQGVANVTGKQVRLTSVLNSHFTQEQVGRSNGAYFNRKTF